MSTEHNFDRGLGAGNDKLQLVVTGTWIRTILISVLNIMNITNQYIETCCMLLVTHFRKRHGIKLCISHVEVC